MIELVDDAVPPLHTRALDASRRTATQLRAQAVRANVVRQREPVAVVNVLRLGLLIGCVAWKMTPERIIPTMLAAESVFTLWTRRQVSPTRFATERRVAVIPEP